MTHAIFHKINGKLNFVNEGNLSTLIDMCVNDGSAFIDDDECLYDSGNEMLLLDADEMKEEDGVIYFDSTADYYYTKSLEDMNGEELALVDDNIKKETGIVSNHINCQQYEDLKNFMKARIKESLNVMDADDEEKISIYQGLAWNDYFVELDEIWYNNELVGKGVNAISYKFVLNDDTKYDFEQAFEDAKEEAIEEMMENKDDEN